jgi:hypothetical protein
MPLSLGILTTVSVSIGKNTINHGIDWKHEAYLHVLTACRPKIGRNIRMQKHSSYVYLKIERLSGTFRYLYIMKDVYWITPKTHGNNQKHKPQGCGISDGLICTWTTLSSPSLFAMIGQEMLYSLPEDL